MDTTSDKAVLLSYLRVRRRDLLAKLDGLSEYDIRRPLVPSGTNLLGLVKHVASCELDYFGLVFGRPTRSLPWLADDAEPEADMWATAAESRESIVELHHYSARLSDATIEELPLDAVGTVPWWPTERATVTLQQILVHMCVETARHAGHADILRELLDGALGNGADDPNIAGRSGDEWAAHRARIEEAAATFR
ncbi:DinB family protein [Labedella endophytica]|uniref:DinB family protein n=1 Tax=Labedella endophytica TaxID=1523160 RepID=A0A3S0VE69_9MICO|nr:DinB family protein [Labedella endophytica]RUQ98360.1 DinB family protein [Labedella endophytica]